MERKTFTNKEGEDFSYLDHQSEGSSKNIVFFHATGFNSETYKILFDKLLSPINFIGTVELTIRPKINLARVPEFFASIFWFFLKL